MRWFKKHLNWSYVIAWTFTYFIAFVMGGVLWITDPTISEEALKGSGYITGLAIMIPISIIVIKAKGRSLWWILLAGWLSPLWLANKKEGLVDNYPVL